MISNDLINGSWELVAGFLLMRNCYILYQEKQVKGVSVLTTAFFTSWSMWNCYFYPTLGQWFSFAGGLVITSANMLWVIMAFYYSKK